MLIKVKKLSYLMLSTVLLAGCGSGSTNTDGGGDQPQPVTPKAKISIDAFELSTSTLSKQGQVSTASVTVSDDSLSVGSLQNSNIQLCVKTDSDSQDLKIISKDNAYGTCQVLQLGQHRYDFGVVREIATLDKLRSHTLSAYTQVGKLLIKCSSKYSFFTLGTRSK